VWSEPTKTRSEAGLRAELRETGAKTADEERFLVGGVERSDRN
jgi:hypothetical protein